MNSTSELDLARELIRLPSTPQSAGEPRIANLLADRLDRAGFAVTVDSYESEHTNVVARWGTSDRPAICLSGHLDTVPVVEDEWRFDPYGAQIVGSRLYGRGAVDMKAGVAALVRAAEEYASAPPPNAAPVSLVLTAQEEVGSLGAAALTRDRRLLPESRCLLIAEPTSNQPLLGHRGAVWLDLVAEGRSCHGSTPHLGENAILKLIDALRLVQQWAEDHQASHEVLGRRTLNIGRIRGGTLRNIVPDRATAELDFRTPLEDDAATLTDTLADVVGKRVGVEPALTLPPVFTPADDPWVLLVRRAASRHVNLSNSTLAARFFTDASVLTSALGSIPTVICGPGSPDQAHTVDEWCDVDQVSTAAAIYLDVMRAVSAEPNIGTSP